MRADDLIERTRLRRKLSFWRISALLIVAVAIGAVAYSFGCGRASSRDHIA